jgi:hypothetical protein
MPPSTDTPAGQVEPSNPLHAWRSGSAALWILAAALLVAYALVHIWLYFIANHHVSDTLWGRYTFIVGSFGSVVTVVISWLFGREVHRRAYEEATNREAESRALHVNAERRAQHGAALATALRGVLAATRPRVSAGPDGNEEERPPSSQLSIEHLADQVASIVEQFFPEEASTE